MVDCVDEKHWLERPEIQASDPVAERALCLLLLAQDGGEPPVQHEAAPGEREKIRHCELAAA